MRLTRLYQNIPLTIGNVIALNSEARHYLRHVLRFKPEQEMILFNGKGGEYRACISEMTRQNISVKILKGALKLLLNKSIK